MGYSWNPDFNYGATLRPLGVRAYPLSVHIAELVLLHRTSAGVDRAGDHGGFGAAVSDVAQGRVEAAAQLDRGEFFVGHVLNQRVDHRRLRRQRSSWASLINRCAPKPIRYRRLPASASGSPGVC